MKQRLTLFLTAVVVGLIGNPAWAGFTPKFDSFGPLPAATYGGTGIPNDPSAITTIVDGSNTITLGLTATPRYYNPAIKNDGAGTFSVLPARTTVIRTTREAPVHPHIREQPGISITTSM